MYLALSAFFGSFILLCFSSQMLFGAARKEAKLPHFKVTGFCHPAFLLMQGWGTVSVVKLSVLLPGDLAPLRQPLIL